MSVVENKASSCCRGKARTVTYSECVSLASVIMYDAECKRRTVLCSSRLLFCQILVKLEFSQKIFENYSYINLHEDTSTGSHIWHDEANRHFSQFCECTQKRPSHFVPRAVFSAPSTDFRPVQRKHACASAGAVSSVCISSPVVLFVVLIAL